MGYSGARGTLIYEKNLKSKISCQTPFKCFVTGYWSPGDWGDCRLFPGGESPGCGFGSQTRNVSCVQFLSWPARVTHPRHCAGIPRPEQVNVRMVVDSLGWGGAWLRVDAWIRLVDAWLFICFFWVTLPRAVHLLIYVPPNGGKLKQFGMLLNLS
jgi:hypothetical protein